MPKVSEYPTAPAANAAQYLYVCQGGQDYKISIQQITDLIPAGPEGPEGPPGADGAQGIQGIQGPPGADGADGAQGPPGNDGADGADGAQGQQGIQGIQGIQGPQGPEGPEGPAGSALDAYPVGAIYISVVSTSPATLFGGTWSAFGAGRVMVGIDAGQTEFDVVEETGGAKTHTLQTTEIPAHTHIITSQTSTSGGATSYEHGTLDTSSAETEATEVTGSTGGGGAHNNLQPYIVVYMWKRTA